MAWHSPEVPLLDSESPLPLDRPFTTHEAEQLGVSWSTLRRLTRSRHLRQCLRGVYVASQVPDTIESRAEAVRLVVSDHQVVTDRTAAWLHGVDLLLPSALKEPPPLDIFGRDGCRVRRAGVNGGRRQMLDVDLTVVNGVVVTTKVRTALDLGRRLKAPWALAALDALVRAGADHRAILEGVGRFTGQRGVIQLRGLAPLADGRSESPPESVLRWHWIVSGLPEPEPQVWVADRYRVDLGIDAIRYGAEYFGARFHDERQVQHDRDRLDWLNRVADWEIDVFTAEDLFGPGADPAHRLHAGVKRARHRRGAWRPQGHFLGD